MDTNKKILLGNKDVITKDITDIYLDVELKRTINEIKPERFNNDFNLSDEFNKENNASLKFCIYGIVESKLSDTANVDIKISSKDGDLLYSPKINDVNVVVAKEHMIKTTHLSVGGELSKNIFDFEKTSYYFLFEIDRKELELQISGLTAVPHVKNLVLEINDITKDLFDTLEVPFLYIDSNKSIINFGTETTLFDDLGNLINVNNNFPFLYDRHWIKSDFNITRVPFVSFEQVGSDIDNTLIVKEDVDVAKIDISLDFPSKFGRESVQVGVLKDSTIKNPNNDYDYNSAEVISWEIGEQTKQFTVNIIDDYYAEDDESVSFKLINPKNVKIGNPSSFNLYIEDIYSTVNFKLVSQEIKIGKELDKVVTIEIDLDKPLKVGNQRVGVFIDEIQTTAVEGIDYVFSPILLSFYQGQNKATFDVKINKDTTNEYIDKKIVFQFKSPSINIKVGNNENHTIRILDELVSIDTKFVINSGIQGEGIFLTKDLFDFTGNIPMNNFYSNWQKGMSFNDDAFSVYQDFEYNINIINKGETPIHYGGVIINKGDFINKNYNGTDISNITLPSNSSFNSATNQYESFKYDFKFTIVKSGSEKNISATGLANNSLNYNLITEINNIKTRGGKYSGCYDYISNDAINIKINGAMLFYHEDFRYETMIDKMYFSQTKANYDNGCELKIGSALPFNLLLPFERI